MRTSGHRFPFSLRHPEAYRARLFRFALRRAVRGIGYWLVIGLLALPLAMALTGTRIG